MQHGGRGPGAAGGDGAGPATARTAWTAGMEAAAGVCVWCVLVCVAECGRGRWPAVLDNKGVCRVPPMWHSSKARFCRVPEIRHLAKLVVFFPISHYFMRCYSSNSNFFK